MPVQFLEIDAAQVVDIVRGQHLQPLAVRTFAERLRHPRDHRLVLHQRDVRMAAQYRAEPVRARLRETDKEDRRARMRRHGVFPGRAVRFREGGGEGLQIAHVSRGVGGAGSRLRAAARIERGMVLEGGVEVAEPLAAFRKQGKSPFGHLPRETVRRYAVQATPRRRTVAIQRGQPRDPVEDSRIVLAA